MAVVSGCSAQLSQDDDIQRCESTLAESNKFQQWLSRNVNYFNSFSLVLEMRPMKQGEHARQKAKGGINVHDRRGAKHLPPLCVELPVESPGGSPLSSPFREKSNTNGILSYIKNTESTM